MDKRDVISYSSTDVLPAREITPKVCYCSIFVVVCSVRETEANNIASV